SCWQRGQRPDGQRAMTETTSCSSLRETLSMSKPKGKEKKVDEIIRLGENSRKMMIWGLRYSLVYHLTQACRGFTKYGGVPYYASNLKRLVRIIIYSQSGDRRLYEEETRHIMSQADTGDCTNLLYPIHCQ